MRDYADEVDQSRDPDNEEKGSRFRERGYILSPPFAQVVKGHSIRCWLSVSQEAFPEIELGRNAQIGAPTSDVQVDRNFAPFEQHPSQENLLRALWSVRAVQATPATGVKVRVGPIVGEVAIEVLETEAQKYADLQDLKFHRKRYQIRKDSRKKRVRLLAPLSLVEELGSEPVIEIQVDHYSVMGQTGLKTRENLGVAMADFYVNMNSDEAKVTTIAARLGGHQTEAKIIPSEPVGAGISIFLEDVDHGNQRYRWKKNQLEIAARHPSLRRYLGPKAEGFPGQEDKHFRVLMAEIVADGVCSELLRHNIEANPADYEHADWDLYYAEFSRYMTTFLPIAHGLVVPEP